MGTVSRPFIIWTMQRTGGTTLTELLMLMSEHRSAEHEPFNWARARPRQFWPITDAWNRTRDPVALAGSLDEVFSGGHLLKHCYELLSMGFNEHLMRAAARASYRHILLLRRDEPARLVSKFIAEAQGTWFRDYSRKVFSEVAEGQRTLGALPVERMVAHQLHCREATGTVTAWLAQLEEGFHTVCYEDLYSGIREARTARLHALLAFLEFDEGDIARHADSIEAMIFDGGQGTQSVAPLVPNIAEVLAALATPGGGRAAAAGGGDAPATPRLAPSVRMAGEFRTLVEVQATQEPYLELGVADAAACVLAAGRFEAAERHILGPALSPGRLPGGMVAHCGHPGDMTALFADGVFGTVLWNDALVHERHFWRALDEMRRVLRPGGTLILAVPGFSKAAGRAGVTVSGPKGNPIADTTPTQRVHDSPDFWRISPQAMRHVVLDGYEVREVRVSPMPPRIFGVGLKPLRPDASA
jgi:hypothetical protein